MNSMKSVLFASAALALIATPQAFAAGRAASSPIMLAQAETPAAVAAAEADVEAARAALREAMASGKGVKQAQRALNQALKALDEARATAGLPPSGEKAGDTAAQPPAEQQPPAANAETPPVEQKQQQPAENTQNPPAATDQPAAETADAPKLKRKPPMDAQQQPPADQQAPATTAVQPPADQPPANTADAPKLKLKGKPPMDAQQQPPANQQPPAATANNPPANAPNPQVVDQPPAGKFDPSMLKKQHPQFGEAPPEQKTVLPKDEAAIPKGGEINAGAGRIIVKEDNGQVTVRHDDSDRFRRQGGQVQEQKGPNDTTVTTVNRPDGTQVVTVRDSDGNIIQRYRKNRNGSIEVLIGATDQPRGGNRPPPLPPRPQGPSVTFDFHNRLPPIRLNIPRDQYIVESSGASQRQLQQTFEAPPVEQVERAYTLEEIRRSDRIRDKVRRVDFDTVTFEFGSAVLPDDQIAQMQGVGEAMRAVLDQDPDQVFLIEGHTDAVGSDLANLALSDRRAQTVAEILTYYFKVPPENLVTQGYGEQYLKVPTTGPERENRRVAFRNITPLLKMGSN